MINQVGNERDEIEDFATGKTFSNEGNTNLSSLDRLKEQFASRRKQSEDRLLRILKESYPELDAEEALKLANLVVD
jgi:hypothetical protein